MKTDTKEKIVSLIAKNRRVTAKEMVDILGISRQGLFLQIAKLLKEGRIAKIGQSPRVYYFIPDEKVPQKDVVFAKKIVDFVNRRYLYVSPLGEKMEGMKGLIQWCQKTHQDIEKTAREYVATQEKYDVWVKRGVLSGRQKLTRTFPQVYLDELYYLDFYSIERFGKTKLGQLLLYAKQSQSPTVIRELLVSVQGKIETLAKRLKIESVGFVPPTVRREVQLMRELEKGLALPLRTIKIQKLRTEMMVPQKTLVRLEDRIDNAAKTIVVVEKEKHHNVLLIDDAVGSGATLNETAKQLREKGIVRGKIVGLAIVGSYKGFDVISEV
jgi:phosphoribosylpyrophosphate synthetase